jgi:hypothetical protein
VLNPTDKQEKNLLNPTDKQEKNSAELNPAREIDVAE